MSVDPFTGATNTAVLNVSEGIVTLNALLRLVPLLSRDPDHIYTFIHYAEPFAFIIHDTEPDTPFTLAFVGLDRMKIGKAECEVARFQVALGSTGGTIDFWVNRSGAVWRFEQSGRPTEEGLFLIGMLQDNTE